MKIRAIRVAEIGRFSEPVAVEGLTGGLDVLAGPNELGKSTLLHALKLALFSKYTSKHADIADLRPYSGGNPTVEVDFENKDGLWRIRKRFLGQQLAELRSLGTSQMWRGADVDGQLSQLLSGGHGMTGGDGRFGLLWVGQQEALRSAIPSSNEVFAGARDAVERALASEVLELTQGVRSKRVRALVQEALSKLQTATGKPRAHEPWDAAQRNVDRLRIEVVEAERQLALARDNLDKLGGLREQEVALTLPSAVHGRRTALDTARAAAEAAREALVHRNLADAALRTAESELQRKREAHDRFEKARNELAELDLRFRSDSEALSAAKQRSQPLLVDLERLTATLQTSRAALDKLGLEHAAAIAADRRASQLERVSELEQRSDAVQRAADEERVLRHELVQITATPALLSAARNEHAAIETLQARLEASQPALTVAYAAGAKGRLSIDGRVLEDGYVLRPSRRMIIEIENVGTLSIDPGDAQTLEDISADLEAHRQQLRTILERTGAIDLRSLMERVERRQAIAGRIAELSATVKALAPAGIERLIADLHLLRSALPDSPDMAGHQPIATLEDGIRSMRVMVAESEEAVERRRSEISATQTAVARLAAQCEEAQLKRRRLLAELPPMEHWDQLQSELAAAVAASEHDANTARRELTAWAEKVPSAEALRKLSLDVEAAEAAIRDAERRVFEIGTDAARIDGELASARNEDVESRFATLSADLERAEAQLRDISDEVDALRLLESELETESGLARDQYLVPVLARLRPLVHQVLPNAEVELGAGYSPSGLARGTRSEQLKRLSDGTKEQLAVLTRLAIARLFSQSGHGIPVILDDALVYADDTRIESMFEVLRQSSVLHQIIVLTCRTLAFDRLGGNRLELRAWQPEVGR